MTMRSTDEADGPNFEYDVLLARSFDEILERRGEPISLEDVLDLALRRGRLLLQAPGGAGKTVTLERLRMAAQASGLLVGYVRLAEISPAALTTFGFETLLDGSDPPLQQDALASGLPIVLLVDGLNEVPRNVTTAALRAIDEFASRGPKSGVVVTDRLVRRDVDTKRWRLATLQDVSRTTSEAVLGRPLTESDAALMSSPVYLESARQAGHAFARRSDAHRQYFEGQLSLSNGIVERLSAHALWAYRETASRYFTRASLTQYVDDEIFLTLTAAGALIFESPGARGTSDGDTRIAYRHHLVHDYLAARGAAHTKVRWDAELFNALTFQSASSDILVMLLEQIPPPGRDTLVRRVYDWNLYSAAYLLSAWVSGEDLVAPATETQVLALLGERRFDRFKASAQQVADALRLHGGTFAQALLAVETPQQAITLASSQLPSDDEFQRWLSLYATTEEPAPQELFSFLEDQDGVYGWTAANVIRRLGVSREDVVVVLRYARNELSAIRWRACHVLGVVGTAGIEELFSALVDDPEITVRYGALRSIVEQALLTSSVDTRHEIFERLADHHEVLMQNPTLSNEFARVVEVVQPPAGWIAAASIVIEKLLANAQDADVQNRWRSLSAQLRLNWTSL
ncbi:hypothetical protein ACNKF0_00155 [Nocardioides sp. T5]|uniref:hypothetical protein n=1 Tax=Nocardioides sp. T5 TaxID=3400182 RepID=UPI003A852196